MRPAFTVSFLEMAENPKRPKPELETLRASPIPPAYFRAMYGEMGRRYHWIDQITRPEHELKTYCNDPNKEMVTLLLNGSPAGFYVLHRQISAIDLTYFGLLDDAIGKGLGSLWLDFALHEAWETQGIKKVTVNTCTLDHPRALTLYQEKGFVITHTESRPHQS